MKPEVFKCLRDSNIASKYNMDKVVRRILNGDGAKWIKEGHNRKTHNKQLDPFHKKRCIVRNVRDKESRLYIANELKSGRSEKALGKIEKLKYECGGEEKEIKKIEDPRKLHKEQRR